MASTIATSSTSRSVRIPAGGVALTGDLTIPPNAKGLVVFAHGSGSSRLSPRNQRVATQLQAGGFATLLFDLLTAEEEEIDGYTGHFRFDIPLLAKRLARVTEWLGEQASTRALRIGYFGASTGAAAAVIAAAMRPQAVGAVVSRGGRPDLAGAYLDRVQAPTLLIVGGADSVVIGMNQTALEQLSAPIKKLEIVPGATHLFEEPGTLDRVSNLALQWFTRYLTSDAKPQEDEDEIC
jgi:putative phosphoribosyl transferase